MAEACCRFETDNGETTLTDYTNDQLLAVIPTDLVDASGKQVPVNAQEPGGPAALLCRAKWLRGDGDYLYPGQQDAVRQHSTPGELAVYRQGNRCSAGWGYRTAAGFYGGDPAY